MPTFQCTRAGFPTTAARYPSKASRRAADAEASRRLSSPDRAAMVRWNRTMAAVAAALAVLVDAGAPGIATASGTPDSKRRAELDVLGFLQQDRGHRWVLQHRKGRILFPRLYNPKTRLLRNNTLARCRRAQNPHRRGRFFCVVRPARHRRHEGLHVRYVRFAGGYFRLTWLNYQRGS
jgi:hypothetical protein